MGIYHGGLALKDWAMCVMPQTLGTTAGILISPTRGGQDD
jgi:hypothetical protein